MNLTALLQLLHVGSSGSEPGKWNKKDIIAAVRTAATFVVGYCVMAILNTIAGDLTSGAIDLSAIPYGKEAAATLLTWALDWARRTFTDNR